MDFKTFKGNQLFYTLLNEISIVYAAHAVYALKNNNIPPF